MIQSKKVSWLRFSGEGVAMVAGFLLAFVIEAPLVK